MKRIRQFFSVLVILVILFAACDSGESNKNNGNNNGGNSTNNGENNNNNNNNGNNNGNNNNGNNSGGSEPVLWDVRDLTTWGTAVNGIRNGGNNKTHNITVSGDFSIPFTINTESTFDSVTDVTINIEGGSVISPSGGGKGSLLRIGARAIGYCQEPYTARMRRQ